MVPAGSLNAREFAFVNPLFQRGVVDSEDLSGIRLRENLLLSLIVLTLSFELPAQSLQVVDLEGHTVAVTAAQIAKAPRTTVNATDHNKPAAFEGVTLAALLAAAGMLLSDTMRAPQQTQALLVESTDGYAFAPGRN